MLHAVVIGIDRYRDTSVSALSCCRRDAVAVRRLLDNVHPSERTVDVLLDEEATRRNIMVRLGEDLPRRCRPGDLVVIYFAGHGSPETDSAPDLVARYLIAHDTDPRNMYATGLDLEQDLTRMLARLSEPRLVLVLLDACFSGRAGGRTFEGPRLRRLRAGDRAGAPIRLAGLDLGEGRLILTACGDDEVAREDRALGHGIFTSYLLRGPEPTGADTVSVTGLYDHLAREVRRHTQGRQTPVLNGRAAFAHLPDLWG